MARQAALGSRRLPGNARRCCCRPLQRWLQRRHWALPRHARRHVPAARLCRTGTLLQYAAAGKARQLGRWSGRCGEMAANCTTACLAPRRADGSTPLRPCKILARKQRAAAHLRSRPTALHRPRMGWPASWPPCCPARAATARHLRPWRGSTEKQNLPGRHPCATPSTPRHARWYRDYKMQTYSLRQLTPYAHPAPSTP